VRGKGDRERIVPISVEMRKVNRPGIPGDSFR
jgi:site-specific recombinase XerD